MKRLCCLSVCLFTFTLQGCATEDEARVMRADSPPATEQLASPHHSDTKNVTSHIYTSSTSSLQTQNSDNTKKNSEVSTREEAIREEAVKEAMSSQKSDDFGDDPNAKILDDFIAEITNTKPNIEHTATTAIHNTVQTNNHYTTNNTHRAIETHTSQSSMFTASTPYPLSTSLDNRFGNMKECTEVIVEHMLRSPLFTKNTHPAIVLGQVTNRTGDDTLPIGQLEHVLKTVIEGKNSVRIVQAQLEKRVDKFDYITNILVQYTDDNINEPVTQLHALTHAQKQQSNSTNRQYTIKVQLLNYYGELVGQWSAKTSQL